MGNGGRRQCQCHAVNSTHRSGHLALDALRVTPHSMRGPERGRKGQEPQTVFLDTASQRGMTGWSPRTAMRGPERKGEAFICRYSWIPHQVRNDETAGSSEVSQTGKGLCRYTCPGTPGYRVVARYDVWCHPALRCGVQREKARHSFAGIPPARIFWIPRHTGSPRTTMRGPLVGIPGFRITPGHPAPRCGVHLPVFLDTAS